MYKAVMSLGAGVMCGALIMLIRSKRVTKGDLVAGACMVGVIAIAISEIL